MKKKNPDTYLEKFLLVHMLIAVNIKHFESYVKSCTRLCNSNTPSVIWALSQYYRNPYMNYFTWLVGHRSRTVWRTTVLSNKTGQQLLIPCLAPLAYAGVQSLGRTKWEKKNVLFTSQKLKVKSIINTITERRGTPCKAQWLSEVSGSTYWSG